MSFITLADYIGVFVFAVSGGLVAIRHNMDLFGILVVGLLPAIGGGTLRDVLLDVPVFWLADPWVVCVALAGGVGAIIYKSWTRVKLFVWVDALGLALFAMLGTYKAYSLDAGFMTSVMMGTITATAGGLIRDVVCGGPPILLKEDIYATAALFGSSLGCWALFSGVSTPISLLLGFIAVFTIRAMAIKYELSLPSSDWVRGKLYRNPSNPDD
ncbi:trimeric intracellular cation channel family protein [Arenicella sp. 4NH20-0111]|uniref:trimeric intracellular cation channel family protein n=1 Tax=Arenicella sp. 4NH20-0111 TaxID=3127648 RepID=UPI00310C4127